jgi:hypothetical protein
MRSLVLNFMGFWLKTDRISRECPVLARIWPQTECDSHFTEDVKPRRCIKNQSSRQTFLTLNHNNLLPNGLPIRFPTVPLRLRLTPPSCSTTFRPFGLHLGSSTSTVGHNVAKSPGKFFKGSRASIRLVSSLWSQKPNRSTHCHSRRCFWD